MKSNSKKKFSIVVIALVVVLMLSFFSRENQRKPGEGFFQVITSPFSNFFSGTGFWFHERFDFFSSIGEMKTENEKLLEENLRLKSQIAELRDVKNENDDLREEIKLAPRDDYKLESAMIIGRDLGGRPEFVYINKGSSQGIEKQMAVTQGEGVLVGRVVEIYPVTSKIEFLTSPDSKINAEIVESGAKGIVNGRYGTSVIMDMIPQTVEVKRGDTVITSGLDRILPRGLLIGYAQEPNPTSDQLFQRASLVLPVKFDSIKVVWVVKAIKN